MIVRVGDTIDLAGRSGRVATTFGDRALVRWSPVQAEWCDTADLAVVHRPDPPPPLCGACRDLAGRWTSRPMPPTPIRLVAVGSDATVRNVIASRTHRVEQFYGQTREALDLIAATCAANHRTEEIVR